jgi:tetratricopeptide (TPR) repeat protein
VRSRTAEQHESLKKHTTHNNSSRDRRTLKAYDAVVAGDKLCAAAADALRGDVTHAKQQFAAAAEQYKLAADLGCAVGMFNCAQLLRLGLAEELLADGMPAVAYQAAVRHLTSAMQQDLVIDVSTQLPPELQQEQPAGNGSVGTRCQNLGVAECHVLAGDMQRDGTWGVDPASLGQALATYTKAANASQQPHPAALVAIGKVKQMQGDNRDAIEWYRKAVWQEYSAGHLGVAALLAQDAESNWEGHPDWMAAEMTAVDKLAALDGALLAAKHGLPRAKALAATLEQDRRKAAALLLQAVEEDGHPQSLLLAAKGYGHGQYGLPK